MKEEEASEENKDASGETKKAMKERENSDEARKEREASGEAKKKKETPRVKEEIKRKEKEASEEAKNEHETEKKLAALAKSGRNVDFWSSSIAMPPPQVLTRKTWELKARLDKGECGEERENFVDHGEKVVSLLEKHEDTNEEFDETVKSCSDTFRNLVVWRKREDGYEPGTEQDCTPPVRIHGRGQAGGQGAWRTRQSGAQQAEGRAGQGAGTLQAGRAGREENRGSRKAHTARAGALGKAHTTSQF